MKWNTSNTGLVIALNTNQRDNKNKALPVRLRPSTRRIDLL